MPRASQLPLYPPPYLTKSFAFISQDSSEWLFKKNYTAIIPLPAVEKSKLDGFNARGSSGRQRRVKGTAGAKVEGVRVCVRGVSTQVVGKLREARLRNEDAAAVAALWVLKTRVCNVCAAPRARFQSGFDLPNKRCARFGTFFRLN